MEKRRRPPILTVAAFALLFALGSAGDEERTEGEEVYDYYCYQCHAYDGSARTLASRNLDPPPRNFVATNPAALTRERMIEVVSRGINGTGMVSFASVLTDLQIEAVVDFVRTRFMNEATTMRRYHVPRNGWHYFERYSAAFPFVHGDKGIADAEDDPEYRKGLSLFVNACISCHEPAAPAGELTFELRGVSYPEGNYLEDGLTPETGGIDTYALHDRWLPGEESTGGRIFREHCAHCHAADGSGRNWIGSFLEPHPPDFTDPDFAGAMTRPRLLRSIVHGVPGSSMPAWKGLIEREELEALLDHLESTFGMGAGNEVVATRTSATWPNPSRPSWKREE